MSDKFRIWHDTDQSIHISNCIHLGVIEIALMIVKRSCVTVRGQHRGLGLSNDIPEGRRT